MAKDKRDIGHILKRVDQNLSAALSNLAFTWGLAQYIADFQGRNSFEAPHLLYRYCSELIVLHCGRVIDKNDQTASARALIEESRLPDNAPDYSDAADGLGAWFLKHEDLILLITKIRGNYVAHSNYKRSAKKQLVGNVTLGDYKNFLIEGFDLLNPFRLQLGKGHYGAESHFEMQLVEVRNMTTAFALSHDYYDAAEEYVDDLEDAYAKSRVHHLEPALALAALVEKRD